MSAITASAFGVCWWVVPVGEVGFQVVGAELVIGRHGRLANRFGRGQRLKIEKRLPLRLIEANHPAVFHHHKRPLNQIPVAGQ